MAITNQQEVDRCKSKVSIVFDEDKVSSIVDEIARDIGKNYKIAGFRKGKAPVSAIKASSRKYILDAAKQKLVSEAYEDILFENKWKPFGQPKVENINVTYKNFSADMTIGYAPDFKLEQYKGLKLKSPESLPDKNFVIEKITNNLCEQHGTPRDFTEDDIVLMEDICIVNFTGTIEGKTFKGNEGKNIKLVIGTNMAVDGFEEKLIGMKPGENREFEIEFPTDFKVTQIAGKKVLFSVDVASAQKREKSELNEELAKKIGVSSLNELNDIIEKNAQSQLDNMKNSMLRNVMLDQLIEKNDFEVPVWMINEIVTALSKEKKLDLSKIQDGEREELKWEATKKIRLSFIFEKIKDEEVETVLSNEEIINVINTNMGKFPENMRERLVKGQDINMLAQLSSEIQDEHVIKWVIDNSEIVEEENSEEEIETKQADTEENLTEENKEGENNGEEEGCDR